MTKQSLLFIGALALSTVAFANPKSYEILLTSATQTGNLKLAAGTYRLHLDGTNAILTNVDTNRSVIAPVKISSTERHENTAVETTTEAGASHLTAIELGGSSETLAFGE